MLMIIHFSMTVLWLALLIAQLSNSSFVSATALAAHRSRRSEDLGNLDDGDKTDTDTSGCDAGQIEQGSQCVKCEPGLYANTETQTCDPCPYDTYSSEAGSTDCTPCSTGNTVSIGAQNEDWCTNVCVIPQSTKSYYQKASDSTRLHAADRVNTGEEITFLCDDSHTIIDTSYSYLSITCTVSTAEELPHTCVNTNQPDEDNDLICYDNCYRETFGSTTRYVEIANGGTVNVDACSVAQCQGQNDTCVTVSYQTEEKVDVTHYSCQVSSLFDHEICAASSSEGDCKVERCATQRCNDPSSALQTFSSLHLTLVVVLFQLLLR